MQLYLFSMTWNYWELLNWKPGPEIISLCPPSRSSGWWVKGRQVPVLFCPFKFQPCHWVHRGPTSSLPLEITFQKICACTLSLPDKVKKHSFMIHTKNTLFFHFKALPDQCDFNSKHAADSIPTGTGLLSAFGSESHLGGLRGVCELWYPDFKLQKF